MAGLFDFARDIGKKLFNREDDDTKKADKIKEALSGLGLSDLAVTYKAGEVQLSGRAPSAEAREKAILLAGNVEGVAKVNADALQAPPEASTASPSATTGASAAPASQFYEIKPGDTLSKIAQRFYGDASAYQKIFEANREVIEDPNKIYPGQKIRIPQATRPRA